MKKLAGILSAFLLVLVLLPNPAEAQVRFGFKAYGGLNYVLGGDLNKGITGWSDTLINFYDSFGGYDDGEFQPVDMGMNFGGEFLLAFSPSMGLGLGAGYIQANKDSDPLSLIGPGAPEVVWASRISAIPITATFYYFLPSAGPVRFFLNAGLGYYLAKVDFDFDWWILTPITWEVRTTGGGLGFHGGLGLEYDLSPMFGIVAEVKGRYAAFSNFEGTVDWVWPDFPALNNSADGKLWATEFDFLGFGTETILWVSEDEPAGDPREAKVDFSGFSFTLGFIVYF